MKTKITLGVVGILLAVGFFAIGVGNTYAAELGVPTVGVSVNSTLSQTISMSDAAMLRGALDTLQVTLAQLQNDLTNGRIAVTDFEKVDVTLGATRTNLLALNVTLVAFSGGSRGLVQTESGATNVAQLSSDNKDTAVVDSYPVTVKNGEASLASFFTPNAWVVVILSGALILAVALTLRKRVKPAVEMVGVSKVVSA